MGPRSLAWQWEACGRCLGYHELAVCSIPQEVGQGEQDSVGGFQERRDRRSGFLDKRIVPQMQAAPGHHSTHCCGIGSSPHKGRRFCRGMGQYNSRLSDDRSARACHRKEDGPQHSVENHSGDTVCEGMKSRWACIRYRRCGREGLLIEVRQGLNLY